jgi:hypothetical protein
MIEAAAILGADYGQGYGIARPMRAEDVSVWRTNYHYSIDSLHPTTALGAMAAYLLWEMQQVAIANSTEALRRPPQAGGILERFLMEKNASGGRRAAMSEESDVPREQIIAYLTEHWLSEIGA